MTAQPSLRCAYCHEAVGAAPVLRCTGCRTVLHPECLAEAGRCPTLGCGHRGACGQTDRPLTPLGKHLFGALQWLIN